jgi:hypothetical protein
MSSSMNGSRYPVKVGAFSLSISTLTMPPMAESTPRSGLSLVLSHVFSNATR